MIRSFPPPPRRRAPLLALLLLAAAAAPMVAQESSASPLAIAAPVVEPDAPAADTLCRLKVRITNSGDKIASQLGFTVKLNGQELPVYGNQLFMYPLPPGETTEIDLYNFWSTETSRPFPADAKLKVEVGLKEAQWMDISTDDEGVEVWTPLGAVETLPAPASVTLQMKKG